MLKLECYFLCKLRYRMARRDKDTMERRDGLPLSLASTPSMPTRFQEWENVTCYSQ